MTSEFMMEQEFFRSGISGSSNIKKTQMQRDRNPLFGYFLRLKTVNSLYTSFNKDNNNNIIINNVNNDIYNNNYMHSYDPPPSLLSLFCKCSVNNIIIIIKE